MTTRQLFRLLVLSCMVLLLPSPVAVSAVDQTELTTAEEELADRDAIRFRESFGLRADIEFVRRARLDPANFSSDAYAVPLSKTEVDEMFRRARIQSAMDVAIEHARKLPGFAGAYLDQLNRGRPVFLFTQPDPVYAPGLGALLPDDADLQLEAAARTEAELDALQRRVETEEELAADGAT